MSSFYEVTAASGTGGDGRRVHEKAPVWAGCRVSHPAADRTLTRGVGPRRRRLPYSPYGLAMKATGLTRTHTAQQPQRRYTEVARPGLEAFYVRAAERSVVRWRLYRNSRSVSSSGPFVGPQTIDKDS